MRVLLLGGTRFLGPAVAGELVAAGHEVAIAHTGRHEHPALGKLEHLHGDRDVLVASGGAAERWCPEAVVDTFAGGASAAKAEQLLALARRSDARVVAISSIDVYQACVEAGLGDGSGVVALPCDPVPVREDARLRSRPYPGARPAHDNVAMERALHDGEGVVVLRPGTIYGPHPSTREWSIVRRVARGERRLPLPDGGVQLFHRVAVGRVARAVAAAVAVPAPAGVRACHAVDPYDWTYAGLAGQVARRLDWSWRPVRVAADDPDGDHPWNTSHPVLCDDGELRAWLGVQEPDPAEALDDTVAWLWEHRSELLGGSVRRGGSECDDDERR